jgi:TolC family type I secretion outer membrane protein
MITGHALRLLMVCLLGFGGPQAARAAEVTLPEALGAAYLFSPELRSARQGLNVVNERRPQALANWAPTITLGGGATRQQSNSPGDPVNSAYRTGTLSLASNLTLPITRGGGEYAALRGADQVIRAQRALLLATEQVVLAQAAQAYMDVLLNQAIVRFRRDNLEALNRTLGLIERQMRVGDRTAVDAGLAQARVANAQAILSQARGALAVAKVAYRQAMGQPPERLVMPRPLTMLPTSLEQAQRLAETSSPDVVAAHFQLLAARSDAEVQLAALLPSVSLQVSDVRSRQRYVGYPFQPNGAVSGTSVGLVLTVPVYQGGGEYAAVRAARKTALQRAEDLSLAKVRAAGAAGTAWRQWEAIEATRVGFNASLTANQRLSEQYRRQSEAGELTILEILNGFQDLVDAQVNKATADHDRILADFAVLNSVGGLTARTLSLAVPYYDPEGDYRRTRWRIFGLSVQE